MSTKIISGPFEAFYADGGTAVTPATFPAAAPTGFSALGSNLLDTAGITWSRSRTTTLKHVLNKSMPAKALLSTEVHTLVLPVMEFSTEFLALLTGQAIATVATGTAHKTLRLDANVGELDDYAIIVRSLTNANGAKQLYLYYPRMAITDVSDQHVRGWRRAHDFDHANRPHRRRQESHPV